MPLFCGLVLKSCTPEGVAIVLKGIVGDAEEIKRVRCAQSSSGVANGETHVRGRGRSPAETAGVGGIVKRAVGKAVLRVEARELGEVIELVECAGDGDVVAKGAKVSAIDGVVEFRLDGRAVRRGDVYDAGDGVGTVKNAIWPTQNFNLVDAGASEVGEIEGAADVIGGDAVDENFVEIGLAPTNEERCCAAALAGLCDLQAGEQAKSVGDVELMLIFEIGTIDDADRSTDLRFGYGQAGCRDNDLLAQRADAKADVDIGGFARADVHEFRGLGIEAWDFDMDCIPATVRNLQLIRAIGRRSGIGERFVLAAFLDESDLSLRYGSAERIEDSAVDTCGLRLCDRSGRSGEYDEKSEMDRTTKRKS